MDKLTETLCAGHKPGLGNTESHSRRPTKEAKGIPGIGEIKWFGGFNGNTGRENDFGFIATQAGDLYFHRSDSLALPEALIEGAMVAFNVVDGRRGKAAKSVQLLAGMNDVAILALVISGRLLPAEVMLAVEHLGHVTQLEDEVFLALSALSATRSSLPSVEKFWAKFVFSGPTDRFLAVAPTPVKARFFERHYSAFREALGDLFSSVTSATTSFLAKEAYAILDERDKLIAKEWAGEYDYAGVLAKMLSARAAEKATKWFYEGVGATVEDVSIRQLEGRTRDWTTHDLLVDSAVPVDVKNARRPVSGAKFYVEHTIPRFKLDRRNVHVRIAGILSPYLNYENIEKPSEAPFKIEDLIYLGETSRNKIDRLASEFASSGFEVTRAYEKAFPNWVFAYPEAWYRAFLEDLRHFAEDCAWPEGDAWDYVLSDDSKRLAAIPALCVAGKPLPDAIASRLSSWQVETYSKLQSLLGKFPEMPVIFFAVLTDFLGRLKSSDPDFSPEGYEPLLYSDTRKYGISLPRTEPSYPLGAIDPLGLVSGLIKTLSILWEGREFTKLERFSNFRFSGLGILQGRERSQRDWTTLVAYCGGTAYWTDDEGNVLLTPDGKPDGEKGKCGNVPLIIGDSKTCSSCGKLICKKCGFCCLPCQERQFAEQARRKRTERAERQRAAASTRMAYRSSSDPRWEEIPLEAYENEFRKK